MGTKPYQDPTYYTYNDRWIVPPSWFQGHVNLFCNMGTDEEVCHKCDSFIIMTYFGNEWTELSLAVFISPAFMNFWLLMLHKENLGNRFVSANLKYQQKCTCSKSHEISWQKKTQKKYSFSHLWGRKITLVSVPLRWLKTLLPVNKFQSVSEGWSRCTIMYYSHSTIHVTACGRLGWRNC